MSVKYPKAMPVTIPFTYNTSTKIKHECIGYAQECGTNLPAKVAKEQTLFDGSPLTSPADPKADNTEDVMQFLVYMAKPYNKINCRLFLQYLPCNDREVQDAKKVDDRKTVVSFENATWIAETHQLQQTVTIDDPLHMIAEIKDPNDESLYKDGSGTKSFQVKFDFKGAGTEIYDVILKATIQNRLVFAAQTIKQAFADQPCNGAKVLSREDIDFDTHSFLHVDVAGQGYHVVDGVESGFEESLNLQSIGPDGVMQSHDSSNPEIPIPNIVELKSWNTRWPFANYIVDYITVQQTVKNADFKEMTRCICPGGSIGFWVDITPPAKAAIEKLAQNYTITVLFGAAANDEFKGMSFYNKMLVIAPGDKSLLQEGDPATQAPIIIWGKFMNQLEDILKI